MTQWVGQANRPNGSIDLLRKKVGHGEAPTNKIDESPVNLSCCVYPSTGYLCISSSNCIHFSGRWQVKAGRRVWDAQCCGRGAVLCERICVCTKKGHQKSSKAGHVFASFSVWDLGSSLYLCRTARGCHRHPASRHVLCELSTHCHHPWRAYISIGPIHIEAMHRPLFDEDSKQTTA